MVPTKAGEDEVVKIRKSLYACVSLAVGALNAQTGKLKKHAVVSNSNGIGISA